MHSLLQRLVAVDLKKKKMQQKRFLIRFQCEPLLGPLLPRNAIDPYALSSQTQSLIVRISNNNKENVIQIFLKNSNKATSLLKYILLVHATR